MIIHRRSQRHAVQASCGGGLVAGVNSVDAPPRLVLLRGSDRRARHTSFDQLVFEIATRRMTLSSYHSTTRTRSSGWPSVSRTDERDALQTYSKSSALFLFCPGKEDERIKDLNARVSINVDGCCIISARGRASTLVQNQIEDMNVHSC